MKKFIILAMLLIPMVSHGQVSSSATLYCVNPSGYIIPLLQAGIPTATNFPGVQAYGMNSLGQSTPLLCDASGNPQTSMGNYATAPATCSTGQTYFNTTNSTPYYCSATNTWTAFGGSSGTANSLTGGFASGAGQPYNSASSTTSFVYPATDTKNLTMSLNRTDSYTEDGTIERPYKTLPTLVAGFPSSGLVSVFSSPNASYTASSAATLPALPTTIYGNNSTWTFTNGVTVNALPTTIYDLNTVGTTTYSACGSTIRSERHGGSYSGGNVTLGAGCYTHFYGVNLSGNSNTLNVNGLLYGEALTGSMSIVGNSGSIVALYNPNMTKSSGYNVNMTAGQLLFSGGLLSTVAGTANIYLPTANTAATAHAISGLIVGTGTGVACVNGTTTYVVYGFNLSNITNCTLVPGYQGPTTFLGSITSPSATAFAVQSGTTGAATLDSGTTGAVNVGTGANAKTVTIGNTTGATAVVVKSGTGNITLNNATVPAGGRSASLLPIPAVTVYITAGSGTYTTPTGAVMLHVRMVGGGGGGCGGGTSTPSATTGSSSSFGSFVAPGGYGCASTTPPTSSSCSINTLGSSPSMQYSGSPSSTAAYLDGGSGGGSLFAGGGGGNTNTGAGISGTLGGGGGGGGTTATSGTIAGSGGNGGAGCETWVTTPSASYSYVIGAGGAGGAAGTSGGAGGAGGSGAIIIEAY